MPRGRISKPNPRELMEAYASNYIADDIFKKHITITSINGRTDEIYLKHTFLPRVRGVTNTDKLSFEVEFKSLDVVQLIWTMNDEVGDTTLKWKCLDIGHDELYAYPQVNNSNEHNNSILHFLHTVKIEYTPSYIDNELQIAVEFFSVSFEEITPILVDDELYWVSKYPQLASEHEESSNMTVKNSAANSTSK